MRQKELHRSVAWEPESLSKSEIESNVSLENCNGETGTAATPFVSTTDSFELAKALLDAPRRSRKQKTRAPGRTLTLTDRVL